MKIIRRNTFETNSSSTHSITMCMGSDFDKWKNGEMYWDRWNYKLISKKELEKKFIEKNKEIKKEDANWKNEFEEFRKEDESYCTYEEFNDYDYIEYETYVDEYKTPNGETVIAFGYYGSDY